MPRLTAVPDARAEAHRRLRGPMCWRTLATRRVAITAATMLEKALSPRAAVRTQGQTPAWRRPRRASTRGLKVSPVMPDMWEV